MAPNAAFPRTLVGLLVSTLAVGILLFGPAVRLDWAPGWLFLAVWSLLKLVFLSFHAGATPPLWSNAPPAMRTHSALIV